LSLVYEALPWNGVGPPLHGGYSNGRVTPDAR